MTTCHRCGDPLADYRSACTTRGNEDHLLPPADDAALGVRVVRFPDSEMGRFMGYHETDDETLRDGDRGLGVLYPGDPRPNIIEVGLWLPLSDAAQQARRERLDQYLFEHVTGWDAYDRADFATAVLNVLGLGAA